MNERTRRLIRDWFVLCKQEQLQDEPLWTVTKRLMLEFLLSNEGITQEGAAAILSTTPRVVCYRLRLLGVAGSRERQREAKVTACRRLRDEVGAQ